MRLSDSIVPVLVQVQQFCAQPSGTAAELSQRLDALVLEVRTQARTAGHSPVDIDAALFAVVAWCDETLSTSKWTEAATWSRHLLQRRYFGITNAGVEFFRQLDALDTSRDALREVFVLCLQLGFRGKYAYGQSPQQLTNLRRAQLAHLLAGRPSPGGGTPLFPDGYGTAPLSAAMRRQNWRQRLATWPALAVAGPAVALVVVYAAYCLVVGQMANAVLPPTP